MRTAVLAPFLVLAMPSHAAVQGLTAKFDHLGGGPGQATGLYMIVEDKYNVANHHFWQYRREILDPWKPNLWLIPTYTGGWGTYRVNHATWYKVTWNYTLNGRSRNQKWERKTTQDCGVIGGEIQ